MQPRLRYPEADIFEAGRVLGVGFECCDLVLRKLGEESRVGGPEETNVGDAEEDHGDSFEAKAECPTDAIRDLWTGVRSSSEQEKTMELTGVVESQLLDNSAPKDLKPFPLVENLRLKTW